MVDIGLPDMTGVEVVNTIRQFDPDAKCVMITGFKREHLAEIGVDPGIDVMVKPVNPEQLLEALSLPH